ncbi:MAG: Hsp33 family molecular chaperone HslO [Clostridia bacterium]|nr:Hsp33 family molecular chaperone HslO [Clostridia bacterium]
MKEQFERRSGDEMLHLTLCGGQARVLLGETTRLVQRAADIHRASAVCTAALGRLMTGTLMMGVMLKGAEENVSVTIKGGGPMGTLVAVAQGGDVRCCCDDAGVELPLREADGKLDVGRAVGHEGRISVVKDLRMKEPYVGQCNLVSGEIAMDFANYFTVSEQQPSLVALGVLVAGGGVKKAGGLLIQPLPGCTEETLSQLELRSPMFADISRELAAAPKEELAEDWFRGLEPVLLDRTPLNYRCTCSRERMERALLSIGRKDLQEIIDEDKGAELSCHFCNSVYRFTTEELRTLLASAEH